MRSTSTQGLIRSPISFITPTRQWRMRKGWPNVQPQSFAARANRGKSPGTWTAIARADSPSPDPMPVAAVIGLRSRHTHSIDHGFQLLQQLPARTAIRQHRLTAREYAPFFQPSKKFRRGPQTEEFANARRIMKARGLIIQH